MGQLDIATIVGTMPKIIEEGMNELVYQCLFLKEIKAAQKKNNINPGGRFTPYKINENNSGFAVASGGPILKGSKPSYTMVEAGLRQHWSSMSWNADLERVKDRYLTQFRQNPKYGDADLSGLSAKGLAQFAMNVAVKDLIYSTFLTYAWRENYFALQGGETSAIGTVTDIAGATVTFDPATTSIGNRMFDLGLEVEFRAANGDLRDADADYFTVSANVVKDAAGEVTFSVAPSDVIAGDTAHLRNGYGALPTGVPFFVDDQGDYKGTPRTTKPELFESVMIHHNGNVNIAPIYIREQLSKMESKAGYGVAMDLVLWMSKTQRFNWETLVYNTLLRHVGAGQVQKADLAVNEVEWGGRKFNIDSHMPPGAVYVLNMLSWAETVQTALQAYKFNSGDLVVNIIDADGNLLDARMSTIFSEHNWDCDMPKVNSIQDGFAYDVEQI